MNDKATNLPLDSCPRCGSESCEEQHTRFDDNEMIKMMICNDCTHEWKEIWGFIRIENKFNA